MLNHLELYSNYTYHTKTTKYHLFDIVFLVTTMFAFIYIFDSYRYKWDSKSLLKTSYSYKEKLNIENVNDTFPNAKPIPLSKFLSTTVEKIVNNKTSYLSLPRKNQTINGQMCQSASNNLILNFPIKITLSLNQQNIHIVSFF